MFYAFIIAVATLVVFLIVKPRKELDHTKEKLSYQNNLMSRQLLLSDIRHHTKVNSLEVIELCDDMVASLTSLLDFEESEKKRNYILLEIEKLKAKKRHKESEMSESLKKIDQEIAEIDQEVKRLTPLQGRDSDS